MEYSYSKPKFCSGCGNKCGSGSESLKKQVVAQVDSSSESVSDDETLFDEVPQITHLDVDYESHGNNVFSFESLVGGEAGDSSVKRKRSTNLDDFINDRKRG